MLSFVASNLRWIAGGFLLTFFSSFGQTYFISLSAGPIRDFYELSNGQWGLLYMVATLGSALSLPYVGRSVDHFRPWLVTAATLATLAFACLLMALGTSIAVLLMAILLLRLSGQGMCIHVSQTSIARWYAAQRGRALSLTTIGVDCGAAILPLIFVFAMTSFGWRSAWIGVVVLLVFVVLPIVTTLMAKDREPRSSDPIGKRPAIRDWTRAEVLRDPYFYLLIAGVIVPPFIGTTIAFHQVYLSELRGWSLELFASGYPVFSLATVISALICGAAIDRFGALSILPSFLLPIGLGCLILANTDASWAIFAFMALFGASQGVSSTLQGALWPELYGLLHLGAIRSAVVAVVVFSTAAGPGLTGFLIDRGVDYPAQILVMGIVALIFAAAFVPLAARLRARAEAETLPASG